MPLELLEPGRLLFCQTDLDARPISWVDDGKRHGFEPELAELIGKELGLEIAWLDVTRWEDFPAALLERRCDAILCNQAITPERRERYAFTRPYGMFAEGLLTRADAKILGPEELKGKSVGAIHASTNLTYAQAIPGVGRVVEFDTGVDFVAHMIEVVKTGEIDAFVEDELFLQPLVREHPEVKIAFVTEPHNAYGIALRPDQHELRDALDGALNSLLQGGDLERLWRRWFPTADFVLGEAVSS